MLLVQVLLLLRLLAGLYHIVQVVCRGCLMVKSMSDLGDAGADVVSFVSCSSSWVSSSVFVTSGASLVSLSILVDVLFFLFVLFLVVVVAVLGLLLGLRHFG